MFIINDLLTRDLRRMWLVNQDLKGLVCCHPVYVNLKVFQRQMPSGSLKGFRHAWLVPNLFTSEVYELTYENILGSMF